jgi:methyl-accepting chemotaxis protein
MLYEGNVLACIQIVDEVSIATSKNFVIHVLVDPNDGSDFVKTNDFTEFQQAVIVLATLKDQIETQSAQQKNEFENMQLIFEEMQNNFSNIQDLAEEAKQISENSLERINEALEEINNLRQELLDYTISPDELANFVTQNQIENFVTASDVQNEHQAL